MPTTDTSNEFLDFNLPQDAYVAFDAVSLKDYIINRLNKMKNLQIKILREVI